MSELDFNDENLIDTLFECVINNNDEENDESKIDSLDLYAIYSLLSSLARMNPEKTKYFQKMSPKIHKILSQNSKVE